MNNNKIVLSVQVVLTLATVGFCGFKLLDKDLDGNSQALYASIATGMIARWMPTPGQGQPSNVGQLNIDSQIQSQVDENK